MWRKYLLLLSISILTCSAGLAQEQKEIFKPSGHVIARGFLDYSAGLGDANKKSGFDITRALLGYNYQISPNLRAQLIIDGAASKTASGNYEVALRNAFVEWSDHGFIITAGQIGLTQASLQERHWNHRYIESSYQNMVGMVPSVDLGISAQYEINEHLSADFNFTNGEGYRKASQNNSYRYSLGINIFPIEDITFRVFASTYTDEENIRGVSPAGVDVSYDNQNTFGAFIGYQNKKVTGGVEYNYVKNKGFIKDQNYFGVSIYGAYQFANKWGAFARYDWTDSNKPSNYTSEWSLVDGDYLIGGVEFKPFKQLKIAPNIRYKNINADKNSTYLFVNLEFNI